MKVERYIPIDRLKPFVRNFIIIESANGMNNHIIPDTSIIMAFRFKGSVTITQKHKKDTIPGAVLTGLRNSPRDISYAANSATFLIAFNEGGAASFFREPLHELFGTSQSLDNFIKRDKLDEIQDLLSEAENNLQRVAIIEEFLLTQLIKTGEDLLIIHAIKKIKASSGNIRIRQLAASLYISQDPFEKKFRKAVGTSPKQFSNIVRLRSLIDNYSGQESLTAIAYSAGYFDQAHFNKDFKSFTGQTPLQYFTAPQKW
jgi:AraC-like DNA-binding protein